MKNLDEIEALARAGDAAAQYRLAAMLDQAGRRDEARGWTRKAAGAGHPGALYTLACESLALPPADMDRAGAVEMLDRAAAAGGAAAARQLAVLKTLGFAGAKDWDGAVDLVAGAARRGYPPAMRELALLAEFMSGEARAGDPLLAGAARQGDWIAQLFALRRGGVVDAGEGAAMLARLKAAGAPYAGDLPVPQSGAGELKGRDIEGLAALAKSPPPLAPPSRAMRDAPRMRAIAGLFSADECAYVVAMAAPLLTPSLVVDPSLGRADKAEYRTSDGALFGLVDLDLALVALYARLAAAADIPHENCELIGVLRYRPGQEYRPHHDYLPEDGNDYSEVRRSGQRRRTLLVYLNDGYAGGATAFPRLGIAHTGGLGDAFIFDSLGADGQPDPDTLHAGEAVTRGEKWLLSLWCRERRFWFWDPGP